MATVTLGTNATNSLTALQFQSGGLLPADIATIAQDILSQSNPTHPVHPGAFAQTGLLYLPGDRGLIIAKPGDYVAVDTVSGWPILVSSYAIASGPWTHT